MTDWRTWAIDEERVLPDEYSWEDIYRKHLLLTGFLVCVVAGSTYLSGKWWFLAVGIPFIVYNAWPTYGAYTLMKRGQDDS